ncbi:hypothetical protein [Serratia sp. Se-RSBMAAmG]|uniref:hypothetical protein n=1 Tax=Serratia sp. Se-RSBMAAmG TaxID=3043305 RepID=UPI0024AEA300|nr:hypothetical protein [Serratia sp. Se-RSBMAAmG]MDI6976535.1 hypothetical protein [Serratia sp. Se-RSBMAAmG]
MMEKYKSGVTKGEVKAIKNGESFSVLVDDKIACSMSSGSAHRFNKKIQAEVFGRQYARGYTGGTFLSEDVSNFI